MIGATPAAEPRPARSGLPPARAVAIALVRHGQTDDNIPPRRFQGRTDTPVNATGRREMEELAVASAPGWRALWSSDLARALDSARILGRALGLEPEVDVRLSESDRGDWEGRSMPDVEREEPELYRRWLEDPAGFRFPGGESLAEHRDRALEAVERILGGPLPAVCVCHGGTIRCLLDPSLESFHRLEVPNAASFGLDERGRPTAIG